MLTPAPSGTLLHVLLGIEVSQVMGFPDKMTFIVALLCVKPFISVHLLLTTPLQNKNYFHQCSDEKVGAAPTAGQRQSQESNRGQFSTRALVLLHPHTSTGRRSLQTGLSSLRVLSDGNLVLTWMVCHLLQQGAAALGRLCGLGFLDGHSESLGNPGSYPLGLSQLQPVSSAQMQVTVVDTALLPKSLESSPGEAGGEKLSPSFSPFSFFIHHQIFLSPTVCQAL